MEKLELTRAAAEELLGSKCYWKPEYAEAVRKFLSVLTDEQFAVMRMVSLAEEEYGYGDRAVLEAPAYYDTLYEKRNPRPSWGEPVPPVEMSRDEFITSILCNFGNAIARAKKLNVAPTQVIIRFTYPA